MTEESLLKRWWASCCRLDRSREAWTAVAVLLGFLMLDSIPFAIAIGAGVWASFGIRRQP